MDHAKHLGPLLIMGILPYVGSRAGPGRDLDVPSSFLKRKSFRSWNLGLWRVNRRSLIITLPPLSIEEVGLVGSLSRRR